MNNLLVFLLIALTSSSVIAQEDNSDTTSMQSIRVEKARPEKKSGTWIPSKFVPSSIQNYDNAGNLVSSTVYLESGEIYVTYAAKFDDARRKIEDTYFDAKGTIRLRTVYQYDASNRLIGKVYLGAANKSIGESTVHYKLGRINELVDYDTKGSVKARTVYTYYDEEQKIESRRYGPAGFSGGQILTFDDHGRLKESNSYELDVATGNRSFYQRDNAGHLTEKVLRVGGGMVTWRYSYEFDAHGRWILQVISPGGDASDGPNPKPIDITKRTISYDSRLRKSQPATAWSLAQYVASDVEESILYGEVVKRKVPSKLLASMRLTGKAKVFVVINELGRVIVAIPSGSLDRSGSSVLSTSSNQVRHLLEETVKDWRVEPTVRDGSPLLVTTYVNFNFSVK